MFYYLIQSSKLSLEIKNDKKMENLLDFFKSIMKSKSLNQIQKKI